MSQHAVVPVVTYPCNAVQPYDQYYPYAGSPQYAYSQKNYTKSGKSGDMADKLDKITRSRNALIIALVVFVLVALGAGLYIIITLVTATSPTTAAVNTKFATTIITTMSDKVYSASDLADNTQFGWTATEAIFCDEIKAAISGQCNVLACEVTEFAQQSGGTGTKSTVLLSVSIDALSEAERYANILTALNLVIDADSNWTFDSSSLGASS